MRIPARRSESQNKCSLKIAVKGHCSASTAMQQRAGSLSLCKHFEGHYWIDLIPFHFFFCWWEETKDAGSAQTLHHAAVQTCHFSWCNCWTSIFLCPLLKYTGRKIHLSIGLLKYILFFQMGFNLICKSILTDCWIILQVYRWLSECCVSKAQAVFPL